MRFHSSVMRSKKIRVPAAGGFGRRSELGTSLSSRVATRPIDDEAPKMSGTSPLPELDASPWRERKIDNCSFERASVSFYHRGMLLCPVELPCFPPFYEILRSSAA